MAFKSEDASATKTGQVQCVRTDTAIPCSRPSVSHGVGGLRMGGGSAVGVLPPPAGTAPPAGLYGRGSTNAPASRPRLGEEGAWPTPIGDGKMHDTGTMSPELVRAVCEGLAYLAGSIAIRDSHRARKSLYDSSALCSRRVSSGRMPTRGLPCQDSTMTPLRRKTRMERYVSLNRAGTSRLGRTSRAAGPSPPYSFAGILIYSNPHRSGQARGFPIGALPPRASHLGRGASTRRSPRWPPRADRVAS